CPLKSSTFSLTASIKASNRSLIALLDKYWRASFTGPTKEPSMGMRAATRRATSPGTLPSFLGYAAFAASNASSILGKLLFLVIVCVEPPGGTSFGLNSPGSQPSVEPPECVGKHERHDQDARPQDEHVLILAQIEAADTTHEQIADGEVEEAPQDID